MFKLFYSLVFSLILLCNSFPLNHPNPTNIFKQKIITIAPCGIYGFYELGTLTYIKLHYDLKNVYFSGASAGAWNALFLSYRGNAWNFAMSMVNNIHIQKSKTLKNLQTSISNTLLNSYSTEDFDLEKLWVGITQVSLILKPMILSPYHSLEDAVQGCIASSHIPFIMGNVLCLYKGKYVVDGAFSNYPYLHTNDSIEILHVEPNMWKKENKKITENNFIRYIFWDLLSLRNKETPYTLFCRGYKDALKNKSYLDDIFL